MSDLASRFVSKIPGAEKTTNAITISGVPASVTRKQVTAAIEILGIDPMECAALRFDHLGIEVEVYSDGSKDGITSPGYRWTHDGKNVATHRLTIPIVDKEPT